jgi:hypothetical protein
MNQSSTAHYFDKIEEGGIIIYEGHDIRKTKNGPDPKKVDQQEKNRDGTPTQNGKFLDVALEFKNSLGNEPEIIEVYEKVKKMFEESGIL